LRRKDDAEYGRSISGKEALKNRQVSRKVLSLLMLIFFKNDKLQEIAMFGLYVECTEQTERGTCLRGLTSADGTPGCGEHQGFMKCLDTEQIKNLHVQFHKHQVQAAAISILSRPAFYSGTCLIH